MKYGKIGVCCILFLLATWHSTKLLEEAKLQYNTVSLRYQNGVSKQQVEDVKFYIKKNEIKEDAITEQEIQSTEAKGVIEKAAESTNHSEKNTSDENSNLLYATFWKEEEGLLSAENKKAETEILTFLGEGYHAYGVEFLAGGYPMEGDNNGIAISETLAFDLYGSIDVVDLVVTYGEQIYTIRGVFKEQINLALIQGNTDEDYRAVELVGDMKGNPVQTATLFVENSGLEKPDQISYGTSIVSILKMVHYLPFLIVGIWSVLCCIIFLQKGYPKHREIVWLAALLLIAICLPTLLELVPQWMLPTRWSDFSFWQNMIETSRIRVEEWFSLLPTRKDVEIKFIMIKSILVIVVQLFSTYGLYTMLQKSKRKVTILSDIKNKK